jgi:acyl-CoA synthetase (AMP-forming)/AMP-acid ligase II
MASRTKPPVHPPLDKNLIETVAFHEKHNADFPMFVFSKDASQEATEITYGQFAKAARRVPGLLGIEGTPPSRPVVAIIAQADTLVYKAVEMGLMIGNLIVRETPVPHQISGKHAHHHYSSRFISRFLFPHETQRRQ